jgi:hypothetical protein
VPLINELEKYRVESPVRLGASARGSGAGPSRRGGVERRTEARAHKGSVSGQTGRNEAARVLFVRLSTPFLPPFKPFHPRRTSPASPVPAPLCEPRGTLQPLLHHPSLSLSLSLALRPPAPPATPPYTVLPTSPHPGRVTMHDVYDVCPHPPAYIFASYNIDYFGRISGRAARAETVSPSRIAAPTTPYARASLQSISRRPRHRLFECHDVRRRNADFPLPHSMIRVRSRFITASGEERYRLRQCSKYCPNSEIAEIARRITIKYVFWMMMMMMMIRMR